MFANGSTAIEGVTRSRPVVVASLSREAGREIVADSDSEAAAATSGVPSARQNFSVSSVSTRLHWGQRFILLESDLQPHSPYQIREPRIGVKVIEERVNSKVREIRSAILIATFKLLERFVLITERGINSCEAIS